MLDSRTLTSIRSVMVVLTILAGLILLAGIVGCVLPVIPGPPLGFIALLILSLARSWQAFSPTFLVVMGLLTVVITVLDYLLPVLTSQKKGASKAGVWGSVIGMIAGIIFFPPFGMIVGAFLGAVAGELLFNPKQEGALRAGWGILLGTLAGIALKLSLTGTMAYFYIKAVVNA